MRRISAKRAAQQRQRRAMLQATLHGPVRCQWPGGCVHEAVDPDERLPRSAGGDPVDRDNVQLLCREHHDWKHAHPLQAAAMGVTTHTAPTRKDRDA